MWFIENLNLCNVFFFLVLLNVIYGFGIILLYKVVFVIVKIVDLDKKINIIGINEKLKNWYFC